VNILKPIQKKFPEVAVADLYQMASAVAVEVRPHCPASFPPAHSPLPAFCLLSRCPLPEPLDMAISRIADFQSPNPSVGVTFHHNSAAARQLIGI
jgi:hypothetical protein